MVGKVLILGSQGRFGRNAAEAFWNAGWSVSCFDRGSDLLVAAQGADVILHGWNPPYPDWASQIPDQTARVIAAARVSGATVVLPGNLYVYGADAPDSLGPHLPHAATNPLGRIRIEMERQLREANIPLIILRAGDFLDTEASGNWFDKVIVKSLAKGHLTYPGDPQTPHAWAFLPDMARATVELAQRRHYLGLVTDIAFPGYTLTAVDLAAACSAALGKPIRIKRMAWWPIRLMQPFAPIAAPLLEMRYLWDKPQAIARNSFDAVLPDFIATPVAEALAQAIAPLIAPQDRPKPTDEALPRRHQAVSPPPPTLAKHDLARHS